MKYLVRLVFVLLLFCIECTRADIQQTQQAHLNPLNEPQLDYSNKDNSKRTVFGNPQYAIARHVGINPAGLRYLLGYSPMRLNYAPFIKPVTLLRPVLHQSVKPIWRPIMVPSHNYLPAVVQPKPAPQDEGWKPLVTPALPTGVIQQPDAVPLQPPVKPEVPFHLAPSVTYPIHIKPAYVPQNANIEPAKVPLHNFVFFQMPVVKPVVPALSPIQNPQVSLLDFLKSQVLPIGATFSAPVLQPQQFTNNLLFPNNHGSFQIPAVAQHSDLTPFLHHHHQQQQQQHIQHPLEASVPVSFDQFNVANHQQIPVQTHFPQLSVLHNKVPPLQNYALSENPQTHNLMQNEYSQYVSHPQQFHTHPNVNYNIGDVTHHHGLSLMSSDSIQPGLTDVQIPLHLPNHPLFRTSHDETSYPSHQHNSYAPSSTLEPPIF